MTASTERETTSDNDCGTNEGLRAALSVIQRCGWDGPAGRAVLEAIQDRSSPWAALVDRRCGRPVGATDPADVVSAAWFTLARFPQNVARANSPWAYLWISVGNTLAVDNAREAYLTAAVPNGGGTANRRPQAALRVGLDVYHYAFAAESDDRPAAGSVDLSGAWSSAMRALLDIIVRQGGDGNFWTDALDRAVDVMAQSRRSYEVYDLRRDPYLLFVLGLSPAELSALAALLIGPRRTDRAAQSLLLALHQDSQVTLDQVAGARARVDLLLARPHVKVQAPMAAA